jgi:DNA helicase HerA-like ATPase
MDEIKFTKGAIGYALGFIGGLLGGESSQVDSRIGYQACRLLNQDCLYPRMCARTLRVNLNAALVVVDLTDNFVDASAASALFEIIIGLFTEATANTGKVLVMDEAHKYITTSDGSKALVNTILSLVRQQRHIGLRTIISTQDPTALPAALLDLCSLTVVHRFTSPAWWQHLKQHLGAEGTLSADWFDRVRLVCYSRVYDS